MPVNVMILFLLLLVSAEFCSGQDGTWLHPTDLVYQQAIDDGFSGKELKKQNKYRTITFSKTQPAVLAGITVEPPLVCAVKEAQEARKKLLEKPEFTKVKKACDGLVTIIVVHYSQLLDRNWPVVLEHGETRLHPASSDLDRYPRVRYYAGFWEGDVVGYRYVDMYWFEVPQGWGNEVKLIYANDAGEHRTVFLDFSIFGRDYEKRR